MPPLEAKKKKVMKPRRTGSMGAKPVLAPKEGTSANPDHVLWPIASILENPSVAEKLLEGVIPPLDKEEVEKLDLDLAISTLFHGVELEGQVADIGAREQKAIKELKRMKEDRDATIQKLEEENTELKVKEVLTKKSIIEEYKSSDDFQEAMEQVASRYFGEGFDLCKKQVEHLYLELDLQDMQIDDELA
ncbi:hypothetical protein Acr_04g0000040 [Actinidia rufa]|uniref:Uncharacterized protein n=1 Tax=Actinidia rufa TaxID=165716 RepID=A0A7J0EGD8_9ERIC|nr:hypothetical protein Acr_04g0000040 [Actinidia rufa]